MGFGFSIPESAFKHCFRPIPIRLMDMQSTHVKQQVAYSMQALCETDVRAKASVGPENGLNCGQDLLINIQTNNTQIYIYIYIYIHIYICICIYTFIGDSLSRLKHITMILFMKSATVDARFGFLGNKSAYKFPRCTIVTNLSICCVCMYVCMYVCRYVGM